MAIFTRANVPDIYLSQLAILEEVIKNAGSEIPLVYPKVFNVKNTDQPFINITEVVGTGLYGTKLETGETPSDLIYQGYDKKITPDEKGLKLCYSERAFEDDHFGVLAQAANYLGISGDATLETSAAKVLWGGFDTTYYSCANGQALFSTAHPLPRGGTIANRLTNHVDLGYENLQEILTLFRSMTNISGIKRRFIPKQIIFPSSLEYTVNALLNSEKRYDNSTNETNTITNIWNLEPVLWEYLDDGDTNAWYISGGPEAVQIYMVIRKKRSIQTDYDPDTGVYKQIAKTIYKEAPYGPLALCGSAGLT